MRIAEFNNIYVFALLFAVLGILIFGRSGFLNQRARNFLAKFNPQVELLAKIALVLSASAALLFFFYLSINFVGNDEGSYAYEVKLILDGLIPLRDFISRAPAQIFLMTGFFSLVGNSLLTLKVFNFLIILGILTCVYWRVRQFQNWIISLFAVLITLLQPTFFTSKLVLGTTNLSILFVLLACSLLHTKYYLSYFLTGVMLALAVFTREINAFFVLALVIFLIAQRNLRNLIHLFLGGMLITIPLITYFGMAIGFERAVMTLFGISHVNVQESVISSNYAINFFLISLLPIMSFFVLQKKQYQSFKLFYPELIWLLTIAIFYFYYAGKRSFFVAYGSEFIPLLIIICLSVSTFPNTQKIKNYSGYLLLGILFCANLMLYVFIEGPRGDSPQIKKYSLDRLAGSGVPRKSFDAISRLIVLNAQPNDQLIAGNLEFAASIGLAQYLNITRPMAYEGRSKVYEMYQAPTKEEVLSKMKSEPPRFIIYDHHLELTFWNDIEQTLIPKYDLKYWDPYSRLFILRD